MATLTFNPAVKRHVLPQYFWGVGFGNYYTDDPYSTVWQNMVQPLNIEVARLQIDRTNIGTPASPVPKGVDATLGGVNEIDFFTKALDVMRTNLLPNGGRTRAFIDYMSGPSGNGFTGWPHTSDDSEVLSNLNTGEFSPANHTAWLNWWVSRYGVSEIHGWVNNNEPTNEGDNVWYNKAIMGVNGAFAAAFQWYIAHVRDYLASNRAAQPNVKLYWGHHAQGGTRGDGGQNNTDLSRMVDGYFDSRSTSYHSDSLHSGYVLQFLDVFDTHIYGGWGSSDQSGINGLFYTPRDEFQPSPGKAGHMAWMDALRTLLDSRPGGTNIMLAQDEAGQSGAYPLNWKDGLQDVGLGIVAALNQAAWKMHQCNWWALNRDFTSLDGTGSLGDGILLDVSAGARPANLKGSVRYFALLQMVGPFLGKYKQQLLDRANDGVSGSGSTPPGTVSNSVRRIWSAAGLSADGSKIGMLLLNLDLSTTEAVTVNFVSTASGNITGVKLANTYNAISGTPFPAITPFGSGTSSFTTGVSGAPTLGPGEALFLEIPVADTTPPALVSATVNGATLVLTYNEPLDTSSVPVPAAFMVTRNGNPDAVVNGGVVVAGSQVTLTLATPAINTDVFTVTYTGGNA